MSFLSVSSRGWLCAAVALAVGGCSHAWGDLEANGGAGGRTTTSEGGAGGGTTTSSSSTGTGGTGTSSSTSTSTSGTGAGGSTPAHCGGTDILSWDFSSDQPNVFDRDTGAELENGEGVIVLPQNEPSYVSRSFYTRRRYDLRGDRLSVRVLEVPDQTSGTWGGILGRYDNGDTVFIEAWQGTLNCSFNRGGTEVIPKKVQYDASVHRYWQLREDQGTMHCETSVDGTAWVEFGSYDLDASLLGRPSSLGISLYAGAPDNVATPGRIRFDDLNGGGTPTGKWCPAESYTDEFQDAPKLPPPAWQRSYDYGGATYDHDGGQLNFRVYQENSGAGYGSSVSYDATGQRIAIEVLSIPDDKYAGLYFVVSNDDDNEMYWDVSSDEIYCEYDKGGNTTTAWQGLPPAPPFWLGIREAGGVMHCELLENGAWKTYGSGTGIMDPKKADVYFGIYADPGVQSGSYVGTFDKYNITAP